jgi:hypothetical protein
VVPVLLRTRACVTILYGGKYSFIDPKLLPISTSTGMSKFIHSGRLVMMGNAALANALAEGDD